MTYTSTSHFLIKFGLAFGSLFLGVFVGWLLWILIALFGVSEKYEIIPFMGGFIGIVVVSAKLTDKHQDLIDAVAAYLYLRVELLTPVTFGEARQLSFLFAGDAKGKWYPLTRVRKVPKEERKQCLLEIAAIIKGE